MSLLEDIFLQDEADEAQQLERVIEGDEYDERPRSRSVTPDSDGNEPKEDEAEEEKRRVDPSSGKAKKVVKHPRFILNPARLIGPRGIQVIPEHFKDFKFKGKGHEKEDLDMVLKNLEHWAYRLYPKFQFEDCLKKIETLGKKRPVMVHLHKIRTDQYISEDTVVQKDSSDDETQPPPEEDEFDKLLQQQIELARATPAPGSVKKVMGTPIKDSSPFTMPKATSSPSISDEQKERMLRNRQLAEERRLARLKQNSMDSDKQDGANNISEIIEVDEEAAESDVTAKKHNRSYVLDSSDDECDVTSVNQSVTVDVHNSLNKGKERNDLEAGGNIPDDVEMNQNVDNNDVTEVDQNVVEIIDDVDRNIGKNVRVDRNNEAVDEIIEINDQTEAIGEIINVNDQNDEGDSEIIEINNQNNKVIEVNDKNKAGVDEIIEIKDQPDKVIQINDNNKTGVDEIIEINDHVDEITEDIVKKSKLTNDTADVISSNVIDNNSIHNQSESSTNNDPIRKENSDTLDVLEETSTKQDDTIQKDSKSNKSNNDVSNLEKNANMAEEIEDIMDVDFSDDF